MLCGKFKTPTNVMKTNENKFNTKKKKTTTAFHIKILIFTKSLRNK